MGLALRADFAFLVAGLATGAAMMQRGATLIKAGHRTAAYESAGYLKWTHALTLHAVLVLPLLARWLSKTDRSEPQRTRIVAIVAITYLVVATVALIGSLINS